MIKKEISEPDLKETVESGRRFYCVIKPATTNIRSEKPWWDLMFVSEGGIEYTVIKQRGGIRIYGSVDSAIRKAQLLSVTKIDLQIV